MYPTFSGTFTKDEATAAQATFCFVAVDSTDGFTPETGLTYAGADNQISKNGAAQGNLAGTVTEIGATGIYKVVLAAGDVNTLGTAVISFADAAARTHYAQIQVTAFDQNVAGVTVATGGIVAASFAAGAIDAAAVATGAIDAAAIAADVASELADTLATQASVDLINRRQRTETVVFEGQLIVDDDAVSVSMLNAIGCTVELTGNFDGCTITIATSENPAAQTPLWTTATTKTAAASYPVTGTHAAVRCIVSADGASTDVDATFLVKYAT